MKEEYAAYLSNFVKLQVTDKSLPVKSHQEIHCLICSNIFLATPISKLSNFKQHGKKGCPVCTSSERYEEPANNVIKRIEDMGYIFVKPYIGYKTKTTLLNTKCPCGRSWETTPERILSGRSFCKPCNDDKKRKRFDQLNKERAIIDDGSLKAYRATVISLSNKVYKQNKNILNPENKKRALSGIPDAHHLDHIVSIVNCYKNKVPAELCASVDNLELVFWKNNAIKWSKPTKPTPDILRKYFKQEDILHSFLRIFLDSYAIKYNEYFSLNSGVFDFKIDSILIKLCSFNAFAEQKLRTKSYMKNLRMAAYNEGFTPLFIYESEIYEPTKFDIVKSRILNRLRINTTLVYARKCKILQVSVQKKTTFLKNNHIQGATGSDYNYGLYFENSLVALMTFAKSRDFFKKIEIGAFELVRYVTKKSVNVVGGASRLLKHFLKEHHAKRIISFCDLRWSDGNLYKTIGMSEVKTTEPNYWYIINGSLKHRYGHSKHTLAKKLPLFFDATKTEYEIMLSAGHDRVWDCGSKLFEYKNQLYKS